MTTYPETFVMERLASLETREALIEEVRRGLLARPRALSPWMFYGAEGSRLFDRIRPTDVKTGVSQKGSNSLVRELVTILGVNGFTPHEMEIK